VSENPKGHDPAGRYTPDAQRRLDRIAKDALAARDVLDRDGYNALVAQARQIMDNPLSYEEEQ
jgi:hypothetical protein